MKTTLFLMTKKGYIVLKSLIENNFVTHIEKVIIGVDKSVINDYSEEIIDLCKYNNIPFFKSNQNYDINSLYGIAISWRWKINFNDLKLIVLHDSLLPKYRGYAPLVNSLINNEKMIGVTAIFASEEYDKGEVILQKQRLISYPIKINSAITKISLLYSEIVIKIFKKISQNIQIDSFSQNEDNASYSMWRDEEDYFINWNESSEKIKRFIDAVGYPYKGAKCIVDKKVVVINEAIVVEDLKIENRQPGKVIFIDDDQPVIVCGEGLLKIEEANYENTDISILPLKKFRTRFK